ncbi:LysR substrate-binding domain-containing protein [Salinispirillum marinum]|uniref:LysR substrate-binding domain-containing protein n=2 Tax=Saccharospirillaceae TaxID=255527 RepID=A0ABV8BH48_9GAMM
MVGFQWLYSDGNPLCSQTMVFFRDLSGANVKVKFPPLHTLRCFWVVCQTGSFKAAAEALYITQAAVSQQIRQLEEWLGFQLFDRSHRHIELNATGKQLLPYVQKGFDSLAEGLQRLSGDPAPNVLRLSVLPSFASAWLLPRVPQFQEQHPDIFLQIDMDRNQPFTNDGKNDMGIRYGLDDFVGLHTHWLSYDTIFPVCHPLLYQGEEDVWHWLKRQYLLADQDPMDYHWNQFLISHDQEPTDYRRRLHVSDTWALTEMALAGQGVALVRRSICSDALEKGQLIMPIKSTFQSRYGYLLVAPEHHFKWPKVIAFSEWITQSIQRMPWYRL